MAGGGTETLGNFLVSLGFSVEGVDKLKHVVHELENMREIFESIRAPFHAFNEALEAMKTIGEAVIAPFEALYEMSAESANAADHLNDLSHKLGISRDELEEWGYVAQLTGSSAGEMQNALRMLNKDIGSAINGNKEAVASYKKLGVELKDDTGKFKQAGEVLGDILGELSKIPDEAKRAAKGMEFFGKGGANIRELFGKSIEEIMEMRKEFEQLGGRAPERLFKLGEAFNDMGDRLKTFREGLKNWFALGFQPVINGVMKWFEDLARKYGPELRLFLFNVGSTLNEIGQVVGGAVDTFVGALKTIGDYAAPLGAIFLALKGEAVAAAVSTVAAWAVAAAPFIALFLVVEDFLGFLQGKDSVIGTIIESWDEWTNSLNETSPILGGIMVLIGEMGGALKMAALFVVDLANAFRDGGLTGVWKEFTDSVQVAMDFYKNAAGDTLSFIGGTVADFIGAFVGGFEQAATIVKDVVLYVTELIALFTEGGISAAMEKLKEDFTSVMGGFKQMFTEFFAYIGEAVTGVASRILDNLIGPVKSALGSLFGGGTVVTPSTSSVSNSSTSISNSSASASINQTINAAPGMDAREVANQSSAAMKDFLASELRAAYPAATR